MKNFLRILRILHSNTHDVILQQVDITSKSNINMGSEPANPDDVIYEVDVVLNVNRTGSLHLFQFPYGHSPLSSHKHLLGQLRTRSSQCKFEIDVQFDTNSTTFDKSKGKQIAQFVNGTLVGSDQTDAAIVNGDDGVIGSNKTASSLYFPNEIMDRLVLNSEQMNNTTFYYSLGYLRTDLSDLQLIPVTSVCEFKKGFKHFDKVKIQTSTKKTTDDDPDDFNEPDEPETEDQGFKKVAMRFESRYENKRKTDLNNKAADNEPWKPLVYFDYGLAKFEKEKDMILYKHVDENSEIANGYNHEQMEFSFEDHSNPFKATVTEVTTKVPLPTTNNLNMDLLNTVSFHAIKGRSLQERVCTILCNSQVLPYRDIVRLLKQSVMSDGDLSQIEDSSIVRLLQQFALLVRGNWVVRSDMVFPKPAKSASSCDIPFASVSHEMLCKGRNYILFQYTRQRSLRRADLIQQMRMPADQITMILQHLAVFNEITKQWDFICPDDDDFVQANREIGQRQAKFWDALGTQLTELFQSLN